MQAGQGDNESAQGTEHRKDDGPDTPHSTHSNDKSPSPYGKHEKDSNKLEQDRHIVLDLEKFHYASLCRCAS